MSKMNSLLITALQQNNITLPESAIDQLVHYLEMMRTWNKVFNLTGITDTREMVYLHIIDSLVVQPFLHGTRMLDVGSGAGLPGIPLAIMNPDQQWVLLDKVTKKTRFMTQVIAELKLSNASVISERCEDFEPEQCFDSILSRAFGTMRMFIETTNHLLCPDGRFIAMKGRYPQEELDDIPTGFMAQSTTRLNIKGMDAVRHVVCLGRNI